VHVSPWVFNPAGVGGGRPEGETMAELATARLDGAEIYERLDRERRKRRMSRTAMCRELGVSLASLSQWGHGQGLSMSALARVSKWLDVDVRTLLRQPEEIS
jgi:DNA-binding transcriptional regulator YiaG